MGSQWNSLWCKQYTSITKVCYTQVGKNRNETRLWQFHNNSNMYSTSYNCGIWSAPESGEGANQGLGSSTPTTARCSSFRVFTLKLCAFDWDSWWNLTQILGNQETGEPRLGSPIFSHGKLYKPAQVDPTWTMNFVFKPVGPLVDLCTMRFLIFELSLCLTEKTRHKTCTFSSDEVSWRVSLHWTLRKESRSPNCWGFRPTKIPRLILGEAEDSKLWNRQI